MSIYHTRWEHKALYNNTNDRHTHTHAHTHTHTYTHSGSDEGIGTVVKNISMLHGDAKR